MQVPDENNKRQKRQLHKKYICELLCKRKARFQSSNHTEGLKLSDVAEQVPPARSCTHVLVFRRASMVLFSRHDSDWRFTEAPK